MSLTAAGRLFHARDAVTGNERSPRVDRRLDGTNSVGDAADRRRLGSWLILLHAAGMHACMQVPESFSHIDHTLHVLQ